MRALAILSHGTHSNSLKHKMFKDSIRRDCIKQQQINHTRPTLAVRSNTDFGLSGNYSPSLNMEKLNSALSLELDARTPRQRGLGQLFYNLLFEKAGKDFQLDAKYVYNQPYPITKESILNSIVSLNKNFNLNQKLYYKIEINETVHRKVENFLEGLRQELPVEIKTPVKYLMDKPQMMQNGNVIVLSAQIEGGMDWCGGEVICKSVLISLKRCADGKFREADRLIPDSENGFKSILTKKNENQFHAKVYTCSYSGCGSEFDINVNIGEDGKLFSAIAKNRNED